MRIWSGVAVALVLSGAAWGGEMPVGLYAITARLELPHLERWAVERMRMVCLGGGGLPVPVLHAGTGLGTCAAAGVRREGGRLSYAIVCPGRDAARAEARYRLAPEGFRGRVAIVMGAKNMTMTEVQVGRRLGTCRQTPGPRARAESE